MWYSWVGRQLTWGREDACYLTPGMCSMNEQRQRHPVNSEQTTTTTTVIVVIVVVVAVVVVVVVVVMIAVRCSKISQVSKSTMWKWNKQSGNISPYGEKPPLYRLELKFAWWVITYAKFRVEIFRGYDFTGGRISHFPIDFCATALPVITNYTKAIELRNFVTCNYTTAQLC